MNAVKTYQTEFYKGSKKGICCNCGQRTFVPEVFIGTNDIIHETVGRCDRENKCGYHYTAKQYFADNPNENGKIWRNLAKPNISENAFVPAPVEYIPLKYVQQTMQDFRESNFAQYIINLFGERIGETLLLKYFVGRSKKDNGKACVFWQINEAFNVCYGKIMIYILETGKRNKHMPPAAVPVKPANYLQTFFGCHLLAEYPNKPVAIVESEKTAIIASFFMPQYNWLATGGSSGCKWRQYQVYKVLTAKEVVLFPDYGFYSRPQSKPKEEWKTCYQEWSERAHNISEKISCKISVSKILENALPESEREDGPDLADFLIKRDIQTGIALNDEDYPAIWDYKN